ncbi:MAG: hypothetical protein ACE5HI_04620, partial [bacterium]
MKKMHSSFSFNIILIILLVLSCQFIQCDIDHGLQVEDPSEIVKHGIKGRIIFNGPWPENIVEARLVAAANFPPDTLQSLDSLFVFSDPIQVGINVLEYGMTLKPATYQLIAVIFREKDRPWDISNILAVYSPLSQCTILPNPDKVVTIASDTTIINDVNITVDLTKGSISGKVNFVGDWPNVNFTGILVFERPLLLNPIPCGIAILPLNVDSANYKVFVPQNDYTIHVIALNDLSDIFDFDISAIASSFIGT